MQPPASQERTDQMQGRVEGKGEGLSKKQKGNRAVRHLVSYFPLDVFLYEIIDFPKATFHFQKGVYLQMVA